MFARTVSGHGAVTIMQWDPTDASTTDTAAGNYDRYLPSFAVTVRDFGKQVVIGSGREMNATWYSWGYGQVPPGMFVAAWRHIVRLFRAQGADNVTWLWTIKRRPAQHRADRPVVARRGYVTWVGIDGYYCRPTDRFGCVFGMTITQVRLLAGKPVLLSETAVGPGRRAGRQDRRDFHRDSAVPDARARGDGRVYVKGYGGVSGAANENN